MSNENIQAKETYSFKYSQDDIKEMYKFIVGRLFNRFIISLVISIFVLFIIVFLNDDSYGNYAFFGMILMLTILSYTSHRESKKAWAKAEHRMEVSEYFYGVYEDYFLLTILSNGERIRESKLRYTEIDKIHNYQGYLLLQFNNELITLRKSEIKSNSLLYTKIQSNRNSSNKKAPTKAKGIWNIISGVLFVASILSIFMAFRFTVTTASHINLNEEMWRFFLFLPIPLASLALGIYFKKRGWRAEKNIVVGIAVTVILCMFGSFSFLFDDFYDYSDAHIIAVEEYTDIDIPEHSGIITEDWNIGTQTVERGHVYYSSRINFEDDIAREFEEQLLEDERWLSPVPNELVGLFSSLNYITISEYTLLYNTDTEEFNTSPSQNGTYRFVSIFYSPERNEMRIVEYDIDYVE